MVREAYKVVDQDTGLPMIVKVDITDLQGVSWREAKKQLRKWYLDQAAALRSITEETYFG